MKTRTRRGTIVVLALAATGFLLPAQAAEEFPPLFPFLISYDGPDNASSMAHLLDAPAGKHGFIRAEGGRFVTDAGPIRLHATNLTGSANFPNHEDAAQTADRLARFGINCVRLHYMDAPYGNFRNEKQPSIVAEDPTTRRNLDPAMLDRLDYLIAAFKKRGGHCDHSCRFRPNTLLRFGPARRPEERGSRATDRRRKLKDRIEARLRNGVVRDRHPVVKTSSPRMETS